VRDAAEGPLTTDAELMRVARSDPSRFGELYDRYALPVDAWFRRQGVVPSEAADLTAETFAQAWRGRRSFRDQRNGSAAPWLYGIAHNLLCRYWHRHRVETAARERLGMPVTGYAPADYDDADARISAAMLGPDLLRAVDDLPPDQRRALELRVISQLAYDEIASRLNCSPRAARMRVSRALRTLNHHFQGARP
jgi:RNA polymerase sigma factor (sigma-70 family)